MRQVKLLVFAMFALIALGAVSSTVAMAADGPPAVLVLEGSVSELKFEGHETVGSTLSTLGGLSVTGGEVLATLSECLPLEGNEKDTNLCHKGVLDFTKTKKEATACRSENAKGEKDPIETILVLVDAHLADEKSTGGVLQPLLIFEVLGIDKASELTILCGVVKEKVKGRIGCLVLPGLTEITAGSAIEVLCKTKANGDQETGTCEETKLLCEELAAKPLEANLGNGFEMAAMAAHLNVTANKNIFIDD